MRHIITSWLLISAVLLAGRADAQLLPVLGAQRAGTSSVQFLKIAVGARAAAIGESFVAISNDASALYWNPAGITQFKENQFFISHTSWLTDIKHQAAGGVYHLTDEDAVGISFTTLHMDDMQVTTETQPFGTGNYFTFGDIAVGITYSRKLTPQFSFGGTIRYFEETLDVLKMRGAVLDFGTFYWTGLGTLRFSAVVSNFGSQVKPTGEVTLLNGQRVNNFQEFSTPTLFRFGLAGEVLNEEDNVLTTSVQINHPNDNSENLSFGMEYGFLKMFFLRGGYKLNVEEQNFSFGAGVEAPLGFANVAFDYGYVTFERFGGIHRISLLVKL